MVKAKNDLGYTPAPCVGCGFCCMKAPCAVAVRIHGSITSCPELVWVNDKYRCRLVTLPGQIGDRYRKEIGVGTGSCCSMNSWRKDVKQRDRSEANPADPRAITAPPVVIPPLMQTFLTALGREWIGGDAKWLTCHHWKCLLIKEGMEEEKAEALFNLALHYLNSNQASYLKDFLG